MMHVADLNNKNLMQLISFSKTLKDLFPKRKKKSILRNKKPCTVNWIVVFSLLLQSSGQIHKVQLLFQLAEQAYVQFSPVATRGFGGLSPPNKVPSPPPTLKYETLQNSGFFVKFECQVPLART